VRLGVSNARSTGLRASTVVASSTADDSMGRQFC
jgi:hypothetical protein